jgi:hypothetical protein
MLLYAVRLPMLIKDSKVDMIRVTIMDRNGISHFSGTWQLLVEYDIVPRWTHISEE